MSAQYLGRRSELLLLPDRAERHSSWRNNLIVLTRRAFEMGRSQAVCQTCLEPAELSQYIPQTSRHWIFGTMGLDSVQIIDALCGQLDYPGAKDR